MANDPTVVVVVNPTAGRGKAGKLVGRADRILHEKGIDHVMRVSESAEDLERKVRAAAVEGAAVVAVLGGDGSVSAAANGLLGTDAALAVFPGGTGDDFAKAIGAGHFNAAVGLLADPRIHKVDVVRVTIGNVVRHFVNVAGAGFDSEVNETANAMKMNLGGTGTYVAAVVKTLARFSPAHYDIGIDDLELSVDAMLTVVGSGISYGGGMKVLPDASMDAYEYEAVFTNALGNITSSVVTLQVYSAPTITSNPSAVLVPLGGNTSFTSAATGGNPKFFLGTDSAPHERAAKENACGCAGMFTAHAAIELYAEAFESLGRLDRLEPFASHFGADFYGLPRHGECITLIKESWTPPQTYEFGNGALVPYRAGEAVAWRFAGVRPT
jgi:diacylglycerol kinase family enzyme